MAVPLSIPRSTTGATAPPVRQRLLSEVLGTNSEVPPQEMRTLLICHDDEPLDYDGLARWLASFSELMGIVLLHETREQKLRRIRREWQRVGAPRFLDVLAFRAYYNLVLAGRDTRWTAGQLTELRRRFADVPANVPILHTHSPNTAEALEFIRSRAPDIMLARCKFILKEAVFTVPKHGTFVLHPGICPEYRNAHGCFWALASGDTERVGVTLLRIDKGVDTGPVYGYYSYAYNAQAESHIVIQQRSLFENLDAVRARFEEIARGDASPIDTAGRVSRAWGQPWLTGHLRLRFHARRRRRH